MIDFSNTQVAFQSKTNKDLKRAQLLFRIISYPMVVKIGKWMANFALTLHLPITGIIKATIFKQFCGGETIKECEHTISNLKSYRVGTILDYSVEGKTKEEDFDATAEIIISTIRMAENNTGIPFAVFKVTGIGRIELLEKASSPQVPIDSNFENELNLIKSRFEKICEAAHLAKVPLFIDAEETWIQPILDKWTLDMMRKYNQNTAIIYNTVQMYRHDRLDFIHKMAMLAKEEKIIYGVKLVRGAYMEKERDRAKILNYPSPIQPSKKECDSDYNSALKFIVDNHANFALCAGTHNEDSSNLLTELLKNKSISNDNPNFYFAQLLGMSDHISFNLANNGFNVAKYVPFGPVTEVLPYLLRRADENTSVAGQTGRELNLLSQERKRRAI